MFVHIFLPIQFANYCVELEFYAGHVTPGFDPVQLCHVVACSASDQEVGGFVEGIARYGEDVDVFAVLLEEG